MTSRSTTAPSALFRPLPKPWTPWPIQKRGVRSLLETAPGFGLLFDPGIGKTTTVLAAIKILKQQGLRPKVLVIAPIRVMVGVWPDELAKWLDFQGLTYTILHGPRKDERLREDVDLYLINPEGLDWLLEPTKVRGKNGKKKIGVDVRRFRQLGFNLLVVDELTKFKNHATDRFKALKQVLPTFQRRWGLTGSPSANYLEPLFGQIYLLDQGAALGRYVTHFRSQFFDEGRDGFSYTAKEGAEEQIYARIAPITLRAAAEDHLAMPDLVENVIKVTLPAEAQRVYAELEKDLLVEVGSRVVTAKNAGVASGKLRQVAAGALYLEAGLGQRLGVRGGKREYLELHDAKLEACEELIEELQGTPVLVAYEFQHDHARLQARLGGKRPLPHIGRGVGLREGKAIQDAWNAGELPLLLGHAQTIAWGLNLQNAGNHLIWFTLTWDYEVYDQCVRRLLRQGSAHKRIFSHLLLAERTIDEHVLSAIHAKRDCQNELFRGLQRLQKTYR